MEIEYPDKSPSRGVYVGAHWAISERSDILTKVYIPNISTDSDDIKTNAMINKLTFYRSDHFKITEQYSISR